MTGEIDRMTIQSVSLKDMIDDGGWEPVVPLAEVEEYPLVWQKSDPRAKTWQAIAAEVANPNLYEKWLLAAVKDSHVFSYPVPRQGEEITAYRPFGQFMKDASGLPDAEVHESIGEPFWLKGITWYFDQWFDKRSPGRGGDLLGLGARAAYQQLHEVFDICRENIEQREEKNRADAAIQELA